MIQKTVIIPTTIQSGTFVKKIHLQLKYSVIKPPSGPPTAAANPPEAPKAADIIAFFLLPTSSTAIGITMGINIAAPIPCTALKVISIPILSDIEQAIEDNAKIINPPRKNFFLPN